MRKILLILVVFVLFIAIYLTVWNGAFGISSYKDIEGAYREYLSKLQEYEEKNDSDLAKAKEKLDANYDEENVSSDNVIKLYNDNKKEYEQILKEKKITPEFDENNIYDFNYISEKIKEYANSSNVEVSIAVSKSEYNFTTDDSILCNLDFEITGRYNAIVDFLEMVENDNSIAFNINEFSMEEYSKDSEKNSYSSLSENDLKVRAKFKVYNIPLNENSIKD